MVAVCLTIICCSTETSTTTLSSNLGGDRLPVQVDGESYPHVEGLIEGTVTLAANGCWLIDIPPDQSVIVFPEGYTKPTTDGSVMIGPDGTAVRSGSQIEARGGPMNVESLPGGVDGFWGGYLAFCSPNADEVMVLDIVTVVGGRLDG